MEEVSMKCLNCQTLRLEILADGEQQQLPKEFFCEQHHKML